MAAYTIVSMTRFALERYNYYYYYYCYVYTSTSSSIVTGQSLYHYTNNMMRTQLYYITDTANCKCMVHVGCSYSNTK